MRDLSGFNYFMVTAKLIFRGFQFYSENNDTEEWINPNTGKKFVIKKSSEFIPEDELLSILVQAGVSVQDFINN